MIAGSDRGGRRRGRGDAQVAGANQAIMSRKIFEQEQIARAVDLKLGVERADAIDFVTGDAASKAVADALTAILAQG